DPHDDDGEENRAGDEEITLAHLRLQVRQDRPDLQADERERQNVQHEDGGFPDRVGRQPDARGGTRRRLPRDRDGVAHHRQDAREADAIRENPDAERRDELNDDRGRRVSDSPQKRQRETREDRAGQNASRYDQENRRRDGPDGERAHRDGAERQAVDQERARVVQEALALEDGQDAVRRLELP